MKNILLLLFLTIAVPVLASGGHGELSEGYWFRQLAGLVNLSVLFGVLIFFLKKPISESLKRKQNEVAEAIENAREKERIAEQKILEVEKRLALLKQEIEDILTKTDEVANSEKEKILIRATEEAGKIKKLAELAIENRLKTAKKEIKEYISELAVKMAEDKIKESLSQEDIEKSFEKYLEELEV